MTTIEGILKVIMGCFLGYVLGKIFIAANNYNKVGVQIIKSIDIDTLYIGGKTMYWENDTLWGDEDYTEFLKAYPKELLKDKKIIYK